MTKKTVTYDQAHKMHKTEAGIGISFGGGSTFKEYAAELSKTHNILPKSNSSSSSSSSRASFAERKKNLVNKLKHSFKAHSREGDSLEREGRSNAAGVAYERAEVIEERLHKVKGLISPSRSGAAKRAADKSAESAPIGGLQSNNAATIDHEYDSAVVKAMDEGRSRNAAHMHVVRALGRKRGETPTTGQPIGGLQSNNATPAKQLGKNRLAAVGKLMSKGSPSMTAPLTPGERAINKVHAQTGEHRSTIAYKAESAYRDRVSSIASLRSQSEAKAKADAAKPTTGKLLGQAPSASTGGEVTVKAHTDSRGKHYKEFTRKKAQR